MDETKPELERIIPRLYSFCPCTFIPLRSIVSTQCAKGPTRFGDF